MKRHHKMLADEDIDLVAVATVDLGRDCIKDNELIAVVLIDFRTLPAALNVFQCERMESNFFPT